MHTSYRFMNEE